MHRFVFAARRNRIQRNQATLLLTKLWLLQTWFSFLGKYWAGPDIWRHVVPGLEKHGLNVTIVKLLSTGTPASESLKSPSMVRNARLSESFMKLTASRGTYLSVSHAVITFITLGRINADYGFLVRRH